MSSAVADISLERFAVGPPALIFNADDFRLLFVVRGGCRMPAIGFTTEGTLWICSSVPESVVSRSGHIPASPRVSVSA